MLLSFFELFELRTFIPGLIFILRQKAGLFLPVSILTYSRKRVTTLTLSQIPQLGSKVLILNTDTVDMFHSANVLSWLVLPLIGH